MRTQVKRRGPFDPRPLAPADRFRSRIFERPGLDFDKAEDAVGAERHEVEFAEPRLHAPADHPIELAREPECGPELAAPAMRFCRAPPDAPIIRASCPPHRLRPLLPSAQARDYRPRAWRCPSNPRSGR